MNQDLKKDPRYQHHDNRPDLAGEHPLGDRLQFLAGLIFLATLAIDIFIHGWSDGIRSQIPLNFRIFSGSIIMIAGITLAVYGIQFVFSEYTEHPRIYTHGIFKCSRHPIYLGALMIYAGLLMLTFSLIGLFVFVAVFLLYDWLASDEEMRMIAVFGDQYIEYQSKTPRWFAILDCFCRTQ